MRKSKKYVTLRVSRRELATILAALRFHQDENLQGGCEIQDQPVREIATDCSQWKPLTFEEVNTLCERMNLSENAVDWHDCRHQWQETPGPTTGCGTEYWFRCCKCGATRYRCVEQDGSSCEEIHPPDEEADAPPATRQGPTAVQPEPNLARIVYDAYPDSDLLPLDPDRDCRNLQVLYEKVRHDSIGDTLFQFLVLEIVEGGEGTLEGAIRVLKRARKDVDAVLQALLCASAEHLEESPKDANRAGGPRETHLGIWRCADCRRAVYRTHRKIARAGPPCCPGCGQPMRLA